MYLSQTAPEHHRLRVAYLWDGGAHAWISCLDPAPAWFLGATRPGTGVPPTGPPLLASDPDPVLILGLLPVRSTDRGPATTTMHDLRREGRMTVFLPELHHTRFVIRSSTRRYAIPDRLRPFWRQWRRERECRQAIHHCWHPAPASLIGWDCCECGGFTEGMPPERCTHCVMMQLIQRGIN